MFTSSIFRNTVCILPFLLAPETGAPAGGGGGQPAPVVPKTLAEAMNMLGIAREETRQASDRAATAEAEQKRINGQFLALTAIAKTDSKKIVDLRGEITGKDVTIKAHEKTIEKNGQDITRLEALAVGAGLSLDAVVPPVPSPEAKQTVEEWNAKFAAAKDNKAQMQVLTDFQAAVKAGKVQAADK